MKNSNLKIVNDSDCPKCTSKKDSKCCILWHPFGCCALQTLVNISFITWSVFSPIFKLLYQSVCQPRVGNKKNIWPFCIKILRKHAKHGKRRFLPLFGVRSTQTWVKIYKSRVIRRYIIYTFYFCSQTKNLSCNSKEIIVIVQSLEEYCLSKLMIALSLFSFPLRSGADKVA